MGYNKKKEERMSLIEIIPPDLRKVNKREEFFLYLRLLPVPLHTKKYMLLDWCEYVGLEMKKKYADEVGIPQQV